jgi:hypothetical protein
MVDVMFINNKYKSLYDSIIQKAKVRNLFGYKEKHHILPRCLGGKDIKKNLVELTAREHFIVHMLLCKFTKGRNRHLCLVAFEGMCRLKTKNRNYKITSRIASKLREESVKYSHMKKPKYRKMYSERMKGNQITLGRVLPESQKKKISEKLMGNKSTKGLKYINKDGKNKPVKPSEINKYLKQGYKLGKDLSYITEEYRQLQRKLTLQRYGKVA